MPGMLRERWVIEDIADGGGGNNGKAPELLLASDGDVLICWGFVDVFFWKYPIEDH